MGYNGLMKKILVIIILIIVVAAPIGIYLNRAYAHIYNMLGKAALRSPDTQLVYNLGSGEKSLVLDFLGDSLTAGVGTNDYDESFPYLVAQRLASNVQRVRMIDHGIPGARSAFALQTLVPQVIADKPDVIVILIGTNDIHGNIKRAEFRSNLQGIITGLKSQTSAKVYLANLPFLGNKQLFKFPYGLIFNRRTNLYNKVIAEVALQNQVELIDLHGQTLAASRQAGYYSADNFHPAAQAYKLWADIIYASLNK